MRAKLDLLHRMIMLYMAMLHAAVACYTQAGSLLGEGAHPVQHNLAGSINAPLLQLKGLSPTDPG